MSSLLKQEILPKKYDWVFNAVGGVIGILVGLLAIPMWHVFCLWLMFATANLNHVERHFRKRRFLTLWVLMLAFAVFLYCSIVVRDRDAEIYLVLAGILSIVMAFQFAFAVTAIIESRGKAPVPDASGSGDTCPAS